MAVTANRKDFMIDKLIDIVLSWTDDIDLAIQEMVDEGIQPNELLDYFDANTIVEALSNNETPPEIAAVSEKEKVEEIFNNADTLPEKSELIEDKAKSVPTPDYFKFIEMLDKAKAPYTNYKELRMIEIKEDYEAVSFFFDKDFNLKEVMF